MPVKLANRVAKIKPSPTLALAARAKELKSQGKNIIDLSLGEPDFAAPQHVKDAAISALRGSAVDKYTAVDGTPSLKKAVAEKFKRENNLEYLPAQILVSIGAKHSIYNVFQALLSPGDEVIIPAPYWVSYPDMVLLADGVPVVLETGIKQDFKITPAQLKKAITTRTRALIINSPSNPTGASYTASELLALAKVLLDHPNILVVSDDIYEHVLWGADGENVAIFQNILNVCPKLYDRTVVINGVSKAYAMTGWRIGYAAGPANLIAAMKNIQSQSTSNPAAISQIAAEAALSGSQNCISIMRTEFKKRHDFLVNELNKIPGFAARYAEGTFYAFPEISGAMKILQCVTDVEFSQKILDEAEVAVVPGSAFGAPGYVRLSYATSMDELREAVVRINKLIAAACAEEKIHPRFDVAEVS